jgi:peptidoglycan-associated lipoprotein
VQFKKRVLSSWKISPVRGALTGAGQACSKFQTTVLKEKKCATIFKTNTPQGPQARYFKKEVFMKNKSRIIPVAISLVFTLALQPLPLASAQFITKADREVRREQQLKANSEKFSWWPTDAKPAPVKDEKGGFWWWPVNPGSVKDLWGNRGYVYVFKVIYDYKADEEAPVDVEQTAVKPSLIIRNILRNVKIYFDYNKADLREDHYPILDRAIKTLEKNPDASILITGNCDARGSDEYNMKLGAKRGSVVEEYMLDHGISPDRIKIVSRGKLNAVAPVKDIVGMQKDRNAQFMVAEVQEVMMGSGEKPAEPEAKLVEEGKYVVEKEEHVESGVKVSTSEYTVQPNDSLWKIAAQQMGNGNRWQYLYELNKDRIKNPNKLKKGTVIIIPVE